MKKTRIFAALSSLAVIFTVSCVKETPNGVEENPVEPGFKTVTLTAGVQTKMNSADNVLRWNTGAEKLAVFGQIGDSMVKYLFTKPSGTTNTPTSAEFTGTVSENAVLKYAAYPYDADDEKCNCSSDGVFTFKIDPGQIFNATNSVSAYPTLYSEIDGQSVTMKSACAYLRIMLPYDNSNSSLAIFKSVEINSKGISGTFTLDCTGAAPVVSAGDGSRILCTPKNSKSGALYVPVIPGTYDDITITVNYTDDCGYPAFVRQSTKTQTFEMGKFYDCKEVSGAYIEGVTAGAASVEGTTLTMNASAVIWKYSGITNGNYTAKIFYAEEGVAKGAAGWTELPVEIAGETNEVTLSASATVDASKTYQFYAQVYDGTKTIDSEIAFSSIKVTKITKTVEFTFDGTGFEYLDPENGYKVITDEAGNPVFPNFYPGEKTNKYYSYKEYSNGKWGEVITKDTTPTPTNILGGIITKEADGENFSIFINSEYSTYESYYTYWTDLLCCDSKFNIKVLCPEDYAITGITLKVLKDKTCTWGVGSKANTYDISASQSYKSTTGNVEVNIPIPATEIGTPYYLVSNAKSNRLSSLVITYEK